MSVFVLKLIAVISMLIDHFTDVMNLSGHMGVTWLYILGRSLGRPAFVIFCYLLVNGFDKTRDKKKYLSRLISFSVISQLPYSLAFTKENFRCLSESSFRFDAVGMLPLLAVLLVYFLLVCGGRLDSSVIMLALALAFSRTDLCVSGIRLLDHESLNVFYTLAAGMAAMLLLDHLFSGKASWYRALLGIAALVTELYFVEQNADYGLVGIALIAGLYLTREMKLLQVLSVMLWCFAEYRYRGAIYWPYCAGALAALLPILLYNGKLGRKMRTAFYLIYPAHLTALGLIFIALSRK